MKEVRKRERYHVVRTPLYPQWHVADRNDGSMLGRYCTEAMAINKCKLLNHAQALADSDRHDRMTGRLTP